MSQGLPPVLVEFASYGDALRIKLVRRPFPDSESDWDRDAIDAIVSVEVPPFTGEFSTTVWSYELESLRNLLLSLYNQVGSPANKTFRLLEATVSMGFSLGIRGGVTINFDVRPEPAADYHLIFQLDADQTYLPIWAEELSTALTQFPRQLELSDQHIGNERKSFMERLGSWASRRGKRR